MWFTSRSVGCCVPLNSTELGWPWSGPGLCHQLPHSLSQPCGLAFLAGRSRIACPSPEKVFGKTVCYHTHEKLNAVLSTFPPASLCSNSFLNMRFPGNGMLLIGGSPRARGPSRSNSVTNKRLIKTSFLTQLFREGFTLRSEKKKATEESCGEKPITYSSTVC